MKHGAHTARILVVDDEEKIRTILGAILGDEGYEVQTAREGVEAVQLARTFRPDLVIVDLQMPHIDGLETIARIREPYPETIAIMLTAHGTIQSAVQAIKQGAYDYLTKPFDNEQILLVVRRAVEFARLSRELAELKGRLGEGAGLDSIVGGSPRMEEVRTQIRRIAEADATVLIEGESGTGKELAARAIHHAGKRAGNAFVVIDCAAVPPSLVESEFFGHESGAFTDAREQRIGKFEEADSGSVFLDEIGELPLEAQSKLLRVLQEREFTRVGATRPIRVDLRVIAATNKDLGNRVKEGLFREDLFYRLNVLELRMPPLREHAGDIPLYAKHFVGKYRAVFGRKVTGLSEEALRLLQARSWKGNIRELENAVQRALLNASGDLIQETDLAFLSDQGSARSASYDGASGLEPYIRSIAEQAERGIIMETLGRTRWNRTETAEILKISRKTLFNKMQQYGLDEEQRS